MIPCMRPKGTAQQLERRRLQAMALLEQGHSQVEVARRLGATAGAVSQWRKAYVLGGPRGLRARPQPGRPAKLTAKQRQRLLRMLVNGPGRSGYRTPLWTLGRVAEVIEKSFGVRYDPSSVWHILRGMGWSCQKPERRARERDERAIARWRHKDWPRIKKSAPRQKEHGVSR